MAEAFGVKFTDAEDFPVTSSASNNNDQRNFDFFDTYI